MPPCAVKTCAVRPVFARAAGELRAAVPSKNPGPMQQNAKSEALRRRSKPGNEQHPGPQNQDSWHMLNQPTLHGRKRVIVIAESLARVIVAIRIASVRWSSCLP